MVDLNVKTLQIGETYEEILPEKYAIKMSKKGNKTPIAIIQMKRIETRLEPSNRNTFYSTTSHNEIHRIINYYKSIKEFKNQNPNTPIWDSCCWKDKVERIINAI